MQVRIGDIVDFAGSASASGDALVSGVAYRSDRVSPGDAFFCIPGFAHDGHEFARDAVARGASVVVAERPVGDLEVPVIVVGDTRVAIAHASHEFYLRPSESLDVVGITGTNGKTTTSYLLDSILRHAGRRTGLIGTVETRIGDERVPSSHTTPESADLQALFVRMLEAGVSAVAMEVSSHAIDLHRVDAVRFAVAAFTNLTQDHLDYHHTLEEYASVKTRLFTEHQVGSRVINVDDPAGAKLFAALGDAVDVSVRSRATVCSRDVTHHRTGCDFVLDVRGDTRGVRLPLAGEFNVSNALVAAACASELGVSLEDIAAGLEGAPQVPGRLERIESGRGFSVLVDYAHTPDSLQKALETVRGFTPGRLIVVFGCGGDRDPDKRPMMGAAAARAADLAIITSDNPRSEDPVGIILQIADGTASGTARIESIVDRREAIRRALALATEGDAILIAGKGHEDYQIFADRTVHFDDREVAQEELEALA